MSSRTLKVRGAWDFGGGLQKQKIYSFSTALLVVKQL
jgi:hypothetical protein